MAASEVYTPQQVLRLCAHLHQALLAGDRVRLRALGEGPVLRHFHLFRPAEAAMVLNHFAHAKVLDRHLWQPISDALPDVFVDPDSKAIALAANAYARASLKHDGALDAIAKWAQVLAVQNDLDGRTAAMLVNGYSKLRLRNMPLMDALAEQLLALVPELNEIDIANVANGYARLSLHHAALFEALKVPTIQRMSNFSVQNLSMLVNAHARLNRRDDELLGCVAAELSQRCSRGDPVSAKFLPSIVHGFAMRLGFSSPDFVHVVEWSLPQVIKQMEKFDVVLTVPSLPLVQGLHATASFCNPVFEHCQRLFPELTHNAVVALIEAAAKLRHDSNEFWETALNHCDMSIASSSWDPQYLVALASAVGQICTEASAEASSTRKRMDVSECAVSVDTRQKLFRRIGQALLQVPDGCDTRAAADMAWACVYTGACEGACEGILLNSLVSKGHAVLHEKDNPQAERLISGLSELGVPGFTSTETPSSMRDL